MTREATSTSRDHETMHSAVPVVNTTSSIMNSRPSPTRRPNHPVRGTHTAVVNRKLVETHFTIFTLTPK